MTVGRVFYSNFTKIKRTPVTLLHVLPPIAVTTLFFVYYAFAGYRIISDVRLFFVLLQIGYPVFVSIAAPAFVHLDRNIGGVQNALGVVESRRSIFWGELLFLLFLSAISMIIYELCFFVGVNLFLDIGMTQFGSYLVIFEIFLCSNVFLYILHVTIAFRFGSGISVLAGITGTIVAGFLENAIGDAIWPAFPWEWGVRFLKKAFGLSGESVFPGILSMVAVTSIGLIGATLWFIRWEGRIVQE